MNQLYSIIIFYVSLINFNRIIKFHETEEQLH